MKAVSIKVILRVFLLALSCIGLQLGNSPSAMAEGKEWAKGKECSNATLKGTYLFNSDGWNVAGDVRKPTAYVGQENYDGHGTFTGVNSYSVDGVITRNEAYTGTYTVNPDCTASVEITNPGNVITHYDYFIAPSGDEFVFIQVDAGTVVTGKEFRVVRYRVKD